MDFEELDRICKFFNYTIYQCNYDKNEKIIFEDGITYADEEGRNVLEIQFEDKYVHNINYYKDNTYYEGDRELYNLFKPTDIALLNLFRIVKHDVTYLIEYFKEKLKLFESIVELKYEFEKLQLKISYSDDCNVIHIGNDHTHLDFTIHVDKFSLIPVWHWGLSYNEETAVIDLTNYIKNLNIPAFKYMIDPKYKPDSFDHITALTFFLDRYRKQQEVKQPQYGALYCSWFEIDEIPDDYQHLVDEYKSNNYTSRELIKYGKFKVDKYGSCIKPNDEIYK